MRNRIGLIERGRGVYARRSVVGARFGLVAIGCVMRAGACGACVVGSSVAWGSWGVVQMGGGVGGAQPAAIDWSAADAAFGAQDWPLGEVEYRKITESHPRAGRAWFRLGYALHAQGKYEEAIIVHRKAAESPALRTHAMYNLGCALCMAGDVEGAFAALDGAIRAGFQDGALMARDGDLAAIRADARFAPMLRRATPIKELAGELAFWVGEWEVRDPMGQQQGTSRIESAEGGCLIIEHWTNTRGQTGQSINYVDPVDRQWRQLWVDPGGSVVDYQRGELREGVMHLEGEAKTGAGVVSLSRMTLTPREDGSVVQKIERSEDGGATWKLYFEGLYTRK